MAHPFVFHFRPGPGQHPEAMVITDLEARCAVCGHAGLQRHYRSTPLHPLTFGRLIEIARSIHAGCDFECENCASAVGAAEVARGAARFAFADDAGELALYADDFGRADGARIQLAARPGWRLDPQIQPRFEPSEAERALGAPDPDALTDALGRPVSIKEAARVQIADWLADPEGGSATELAPDHWLVLDADPVAAAELAAELIDPRLTLVPLDALPEGLPTHRDPARIAGRWRGWAQAAFVAAVEGGAGALVALDAEAALDRIEETLEEGRLRYEIEGEGAAAVLRAITTPRGGAYAGGALPIDALLRRAAHTGLTAGVAARLTGEEIVGTLLGVWREP